MHAVSDKGLHLISYVDLEKPELSALRGAADPARAFVAFVTTPPRPGFRFEYDRKAELLAFLREHYQAWRHLDTGETDRVAGLTVEQARAARALSAVPELGKAWWATGDPRYGEAFQRFYLSVPTGEMFNWDSFNGTQPAIELDAFFLLVDCPGFSAEGRIAFLDHMHAIADNAWDVHTSRWEQIMLGPEGHNWYLHGMHGLPLIGLLFPEFKRSSFFLRAGWSVVEEHVRGHYKADGGARETTLGYQAGSMLVLWDLYCLAQRNGHPVSAGFAERLVRSTLFLLRLMSPQGGLPSFGDGGHAAGGLTELAATAAALSGDGECKWYAQYCRAQLEATRQRRPSGEETPGAIPLCAFWNVGLAGALTYARTRARNPDHVSVLMGPTGYAAMRNGDRPKANYLAIAAADRGPIVTSHGHNDVFALEVHASGVRFLGEMGCAPYGISPGRAYDQKTEAHTCLAVEGMEQAPIVSEWRWAGCVIPAARRWISEPTHDFFHGVHEGYYRWPEHQTLHARKVFFVKTAPSYWVVMDWVESNLKNQYRVYFHGCVPGRLRRKAILLGEEKAPRLAVMPPAGDRLAAKGIISRGLKAYIREKRLDPDRYPCFAYAKRAASHCFVWVLVPLAPEEALPRVKRLGVLVNGVVQRSHGASAVEIAFSDLTDTLCVSHKDFDGDLEFGEHRAWGHLAFRRIARGGETLLAIDHTMADGTCGR